MRALFLAFTVICFAAALIAPDRAEMFAGLKRICTQSGQVVKSYFDPTYGGVSGTFLNATLVCLACLLIYCLPGAKPDGLSALAFFLTAGFCFWGTTILNIWFSIAWRCALCDGEEKEPRFTFERDAVLNRNRSSDYRNAVPLSLFQGYGVGNDDVWRIPDCARGRHFHRFHAARRSRP